ncbi:MAG TPA: ACT domain-containing protein [Kineosporiaceae bacterium]|nr:ACT domain-containing protein [Kineosporiaceae bacterium]
MLARIRLKVPDRPGSLGRVASAIGAASGDIAGVDVLDNEAGQALDDVVVQVRDTSHLTRVLDGLAAVPGVEVVGVHHPAPPVPGHADLQLVAQVLARPDRSLQTLVDGAPVALGVDWAAILHADDEGLSAVAASPDAPAGLPAVNGALRLRAVQIPVPDGPSHPGVLVPLEGCPLGLVLGRAGLEFHSREIWRLGQLGGVVGPCLAVPAPA